MFKVTVDDELFENVLGVTYPGGTLIVMQFADGSTRGVAGFVDFLVERIDNPQVK